MKNWISVKDKIPNEDVSVLVLQDGNSVCKNLVIQASLFQGNWYPDHLDGLIDLDDALEVEFWTPLPVGY